MNLSSPSFENKEKIPSKHTCDGINTSPELNISGAPSGTKSFVLIMDDPDVPKSIREDGMWDHWIVFNISPSTKKIPEGQEPIGMHGKGTGGNKNYYGPCPPDREHRYFFKLYALDTMLDLAEGSSKKEVEKAMKGHVIAEAVLMGRYERK